MKKYIRDNGNGLPVQENSYINSSFPLFLQIYEKVYLRHLHKELPIQTILNLNNKGSMQTI